MASTPDSIASGSGTPIPPTVDTTSGSSATRYAPTNQQTNVPRCRPAAGSPMRDAVGRNQIRSLACMTVAYQQAEVAAISPAQVNCWWNCADVCTHKGYGHV